MTAVVTLPQRLETPGAACVQRARELATVMPFLDGLHVALAERLGVPLVITDPTATGGAARGELPSAVRCEVLSPPAWLYPDQPGPP